MPNRSDRTKAELVAEAMARTPPLFSTITAARATSKAKLLKLLNAPAERRSEARGPRDEAREPRQPRSAQDRQREAHERIRRAKMRRRVNPQARE